MENVELLKQIYDKVGDIKTDVAVIKTQISGKNGLMDRMEVTETEVRSLNNLKWKIWGGITVIVFVLGLIARMMKL